MSYSVFIAWGQTTNGDKVAFGANEIFKCKSGYLVRDVQEFNQDFGFYISFLGTERKRKA